MIFSIETLNHLGKSFLHFAWPMLWQSSLLILVLLTFDFALRRRLRASIRYALWLVVLLKLCLPPTLALPTSPAWWLHGTPPPVAAKAAPHYTVTYNNGPMPEIPQVPLPVFVPPRPAMNFAAWLLVISAAISSALLVWLLVRWWQITRHVRRAKTSDRLTALAGGAQKIVGIKINVPVKLTQNSMSPAVCGLFRPAILIPETLAENFSDEQLRAVLLHELIHLRRRDVWANFLQALLQIFYWWHPLVWLANARIRAVREEAVDDAVMLALRDEAEAYAPTLLEVAKLALNRPLASLGLVGILESRHALRQRIERLVDFHPPRQAGLTLVSLLGILTFTAVAVPMGGAPGPAEKHAAPVVGVVATVAQETNPPSVLVASEIYQMRAGDFDKIISGLKFNPSGTDNPVGTDGDPWWSASPEKFRQLTTTLKSSGLQPITRPRIQTASGRPAQMYVGDGTNGIEFVCTPFVAGDRIELTILEKAVALNMSAAFTYQFRAKATVENFGGFVIRAKNAIGSSGSNLVVVTGVQLVTNKSSAQPVSGAGKLVQDGKLLYEMGKLDEAELNLSNALKLDPGNETANYYLKATRQARIQSNADTLVHTNEVEKKWILPTTNALNYVGPRRRAIVDKLERIWLENFSTGVSGLPLHEVLKQLAEQSKLRDPAHEGINFLINNNPEPSGQPTNTTASAEPLDVGAFSIQVPNLTNIRLADVLDAIVLTADHPLEFSIQDYAIVFSAKTPQLFMRTFKVDKLVFAVAPRKETQLQTTNVSELARKFVAYLGVNLESPQGKAVFYNERLGALFVKATEADLDTIERAIMVLNQAPPQIHIKARFYAVPKGTQLDFQKITGASNSSTTQLAGILNATNAKAIIQALQTQSGFEVLAEPEVTTSSGRQTQIRATDLVTVVTNMMFQDTFTNQDGTLGTNAISPQTGKFEIGPVLDVVPNVLSDGYTINLALNPSLTEFLGYDESTNTRAVYDRAGEKIDLPEILLRFRIRQVTATLNLWDGQTALFAGLPEIEGRPEITQIGGSLRTQKPKTEAKQVLVLITATIVDPAGNRVHTEDEMSFKQNSAPVQPPPKK